MMKMEIKSTIPVNQVLMACLVNLILCVNLSLAQRPDILLQPEAQNIEDIIFKGNTNSQTFQIGSTVQEIINILGQPDKTESYHFEIDEEFGSVLRYSNSNIFTIDNMFMTFTIRSGEILVGKEGHFFRVGDPVEKIFLAFPQYENAPIHSEYLSIPLKIENHETECTRLIITFENGLIKEIYRHDC